jgi:hypothetical protein
VAPGDPPSVTVATTPQASRARALMP